MASQSTRIAAYCLVVKGESLLLCRLAAVEPDAGKWTLPGGGLEFGETPEETAIREMREETGLRVRLAGLAGIDSEYYGTADRTLHSLRIIYHAEVLEGELTDERDGTTDTAAYIPFADIPALPLVSLAEKGFALALERPL